MGFLRRRLVTAALTANAIRPLPGFRAGIPSFFAGWITGELAPHLLAFTAADTAAHVVHPRGGTRDRAGLALAAVAAGGLAYLALEGHRDSARVAEALTNDLGDDWDTGDALEAAVATTVRRLANPFAMTRAGTRAGVRVEKNIEFAPYGRRGKLDVYTSEATPSEGAPVLLQVHGGGWTIGNKDQQGVPLMQHMAERGWVCVAINYRLAPRDPWPAQIVDVKRGIAWIKEHIAEYGGNPDYVVITGGSAGGHLTALAALTPDDPAFQPGFEDADTTVQAAVPHYGVYDWAGASGLQGLDVMRDRFLAKRIVQRRWEDDPQIFEDASPLLRITPDAPDFFVLHGAQDTLVSVRQAQLFVDRLREVSKRTVAYAELPGAQHAFDVFPSIRSQHIVRAIDRYLTWHWSTWKKGHRWLSTGAGGPVEPPTGTA